MDSLRLPETEYGMENALEAFWGSILGQNEFHH